MNSQKPEAREQEEQVCRPRGRTGEGGGQEGQLQLEEKGRGGVRVEEWQ